MTRMPHRRTTVGATVLITATALVAPTATATAARAPHPTPGQVLTAAAVTADREGGVGVVAAASKDRSAWSTAAGLRSVTTKARARLGDRARIGSVTKTMVATVALQLVDEGRLSLSTRIDQVTPGLVPGHGDVTLEQLLSHRSGIPDYALPLMKQLAAGKETSAQFFGRTHTDSELIRLALTQKAGKPGSGFAYANTNYVIVGQMLQRRTGKPLGQLLQERVFRRARLSGTYYAAQTWVPTTFLTEHYVQPGGPVPFVQNATVFGAAGAVVSTPQDLDTFMRSLMQGRLMSRKSLDQMLRPRTTSPAAYGLGIMMLADPCTPKGAKKPNMLYGHNGLTFGTLTMSAVTRDGRRVASAMVTGRDYTRNAAAKLGLANQIVGKAHAAMC